MGSQHVLQVVLLDSECTATQSQSSLRGGLTLLLSCSEPEWSSPLINIMASAPTLFSQAVVQKVWMEDGKLSAVENLVIAILWSSNCMNLVSQIKPWIHVVLLMEFPSL